MLFFKHTALKILYEIIKQCNICGHRVITIYLCFILSQTVNFKYLEFI